MSDDVPLGALFGLLLVLLALSAFFSSSETALISLNRHRLQQRARAGHAPAQLAERLLQRPDQLIGLILLGNHVTKLAAAALVTVISLRLGSDAALLVAILILGFVVVVFADIAPKAFAARNPARIALPAAFVYYPLLRISWPLVWFVNRLANGLLRLLGVHPDNEGQSLTAEEVRTAVAEAGIIVPRRHQQVLLDILDLDQLTVADVMVPRQEIVGIDLAQPWATTIALVSNCPFDRLPVFRHDIDEILGIVRVRQLLPLLSQGILNEASLLEHLREPYFVPESTPLNEQLLNFQQHQRRGAFVVDEYGDVQGLVTAEDILREIVGAFDAREPAVQLGIVRENEHSFLVDASTNVRQLNRLMEWDLPTEGPRTLNGLLLERLETIPAIGTHHTIGECAIEILETTEHAIKKVRITTPTIPTGTELPRAAQF